MKQITSLFFVVPFCHHILNLEFPPNSHLFGWTYTEILVATFDSSFSQTPRFHGRTPESLYSIKITSTFILLVWPIKIYSHWWFCWSALARGRINRARPKLHQLVQGHLCGAVLIYFCCTSNWILWLKVAS